MDFANFQTIQKNEDNLKQIKNFRKHVKNENAETDKD
jgi:hypothetical protein